MRRYVLADYLEHEPDAPTTEIVALSGAATAAVPTPRLIAGGPDRRALRRTHRRYGRA